MDIDIRVVDEEGDGVADARVFMSYPFTQQEDYTDDDGWAHFERPETLHGGVRTDIYVNGDLVAENEWLEDGDTRSFTV